MWYRRDADEYASIDVGVSRTVGGEPGQFIDSAGALSAGLRGEVEDEELPEGGVGVGVLGFLECR
jgi:hypothetical protein